MSAIEHLVKEFQSEADLSPLPGHAVKTTDSRFALTRWFDDLTLAGKIRTLMIGLTGLAALAWTVVGIGLSELYDRATSDSHVAAAITDAADLKADTQALRYETVRLIFGGEANAIERVRERQAKAVAELAAIRKTILVEAPQHSDHLDQIKVDLQEYNKKFEELRDSLAREGRSTASVTLAYELSAKGDALLLEAERLQDGLATTSQKMFDATLAYFFNLVKILIAITVVAAAVLALGIRYLTVNYSRKIKEISVCMAKLTQSDDKFEIGGAERKDEVGDMVRAIIQFKLANSKLKEWAKERAERAEKEIEVQQERQSEREQLEARKSEMLVELADQFERSIGEVVSGVAAAATQLQTTASTMAGSAEESATQTAEVVKSMEEANAGATAAAAASDEFAMSIGEISRQAASSAELARKASLSATQADETISALSASAEQVGQIVEMIQTIAQRTNLLALNASIEAARGGEAGRGFAVVASEVKELATQTSRATGKVVEQIRAMQDSTGASVGALRTIAEQISQLEATAVSIASAVDQQSVAGQDLARSIDLAARSTDRVASHIEDVRELALSTGAAASQVLCSATDLDEQASTLRTQVQDFLNKVRRG